MKGMDGMFVKQMNSKLASFNFNDVVDIALVTLILFGVYKFIRRRRALPVLVGVAVYLGAMLLASLLDMQATYAILKFMTVPGTIALFIVFQSDIRSGLEKIGVTVIGVGRLFKHKFLPISASPEADSLAQAVLRLSESKTGALIVLEKSTGVEDIGQGGVKLDAKITSELVCNIFYPPAPLHDGAVIINKKRISAAGCVLPNYSDPSLPQSYGSRHRAAIGMSRNSDADVIVVSEEDGRISHAVGGELIRGVDVEYVRGICYKYYGVRLEK